MTNDVIGQLERVPTDATRVFAALAAAVTAVANASLVPGSPVPV